MTTTRRHPRTSVEAFPRHTDYACAVEIPVGHRPLWARLLRMVRKLWRSL